MSAAQASLPLNLPTWLENNLPWTVDYSTEGVAGHLPAVAKPWPGGVMRSCLWLPLRLA